MSYVVNLGLDPDLPMMVFADLSLIYEFDYVPAARGRRLPVTEARIDGLVQRAIRDVRSALQLTGDRARDYLEFRLLVVDTLCRDYGFVYAQSTINNILSREVKGLVEHVVPKI